MSHASNAHPGTAMDQAVRNSFEALLTAIRACAEDWRRRAREALDNRNDASAEEYVVTTRCITGVAEEVAALYCKWKKIWPEPPVPHPTPNDHPRPRKGPRSKLRVDLNGGVVECPTAAETFARTIEALGIQRVMRLGKTLSGIPLIGTSKASGYQEQFRVGEFYVCTHSNNPTKKRLLEEVAAELGVPVRVEVISP